MRAPKGGIFLNAVRRPSAAAPSPLPCLPFGGLDAGMLHLLAMGLMLLDHLWAVVVPGNNWMTCLGRLAFPIFAFMISEGYYHTRDRRRYARRLLVAALLSEVPYDLMAYSTVFFPFHQNVIFTLLFGLLGLEAVDHARTRRTGGALLAGLLGLAGACLAAGIGFTDYGMAGVLTVVLFGVCRGFPGAWAAQLGGMVLLHGVLLAGEFIPLKLPFGVWELPVQGLAVLVLLPIWLYNGKKGRGGRGWQYACYLFYPAHMLLLHLITLWR